jgi:hypothetical protein
MRKWRPLILAFLSAALLVFACYPGVLTGRRGYRTVRLSSRFLRRARRQVINQQILPGAKTLAVATGGDDPPPSLSPIGPDLPALPLLAVLPCTPDPAALACLPGAAAVHSTSPPRYLLFCSLLI